MNPPILILPPRYTPDSIALWKAATAAGWRVERLPDWRVPEWLELTGAGISILFMVMLAAANLAAVFRARPGEVVRTVGLKSRLLGSLVETSHPAVIAAVGAAFYLLTRLF